VEENVEPVPETVVTIVPQEELTHQLVLVQMVNILTLTTIVNHVHTNVKPVSPPPTTVLSVLKTESTNQPVLVPLNTSMMDLIHYVLPVPKDVLLVPNVILVLLVLPEELMLHIVDVQSELLNNVELLDLTIVILLVILQLVSLVTFNVTLVLQPLLVVMIVLVTENSPLLVLVQPDIMILVLNTAHLVLPDVPPVQVLLITVSSVLKVELTHHIVTVLMVNISMEPSVLIVLHNVPPVPLMKSVSLVILILELKPQFVIA
jgi:hypothetical protein